MFTLLSRVLLLSYLFVVVATATAEEAGFVPLFDGKTLEGFTQKGGKAKYVVENGEISPETWRTIKDQLASHGAVEAAFERAVKYGERAKAQLIAAFPASTERDGLVALTDYVLSRDR